LRDGVDLAVNAGREVTNIGSRIEGSGNHKYRKVTAEDENRVFPGNLPCKREHQEERTQQKLIRNWIEVLANRCLLMQNSRKEPIEGIAQTCCDKQTESPFVIAVHHVHDDKRIK
jgi:hypothetical protein